MLRQCEFRIKTRAETSEKKNIEIGGPLRVVPVSLLDFIVSVISDEKIDDGIIPSSVG